MIIAEIAKKSAYSLIGTVRQIRPLGTGMSRRLLMSRIEPITSGRDLVA